MQVGELGELYYDRSEPQEDVTTWVYEAGSFTPLAKLQDGEQYSIVSDYLGTPIQAFNSQGSLIWERELDIYGRVRKERGPSNFVPMRYQGQYFDNEIGLCYNRFRYYDPEQGNYISQDPIGLAGGNPTLYGYVGDTNTEIDPFGLDIIDDAWKVVTENINNSNKTTVLGHFPRKDMGEVFESYIEKAIRKNANYFNIGNMWNDVSEVIDPWKLNERFLDVITKRGDDILLNVPKNKIRPGSYLEKEIKYLLEKGYEWKNQWSLKKVCK